MTIHFHRPSGGGGVEAEEPKVTRSCNQQPSDDSEKCGITILYEFGVDDGHVRGLATTAQLISPTKGTGDTYSVIESIKQMKCHQAVIIVTNNVEMRSLLRPISQNLKQHSFIDGTRDQMSVSRNYKYLSPCAIGKWPSHSASDM